MPFDEKVLEKAVKELYQKTKKKPTAGDFCAMFKAIIGEDKLKSDGEDYFNDPKLAWALMRLVGEESGKKLHLKIDQAKTKVHKMLSKQGEVAKEEVKWTLRHYTKAGSYTKLKTTVELVTLGIAKSANTNDADWNGIGNVGYSFYLLCVGDAAPKRTFLKDMKEYAAFPIEDLPTVFVSGDMLGAGQGKPNGFIGSGLEVKQALLSLPVDKSSPEKFLDALDTHFGNFEAKVPGQLVAKKWEKKK
jgi:hypothetical protein